MKSKKTRWYMKGLAPMSFLVLTVVEMSLSTNCLMLFHQPKVPASLTKND